MSSFSSSIRPSLLFSLLRVVAIATEVNAPVIGARSDTVEKALKKAAGDRIDWKPVSQLLSI